jgi:hypothetical protein
MNNVINDLTNSLGIERRTTQAYNPRTDGLCEKGNHTTGTMLSKLAEANPERWTDWLGYVELSYNTRTNNITKFSPYELLYGKKMNKFKDWQTKEMEEEEAQIIKRTMEIKELIEKTRKEALENIEIETMQLKII